MTEQEMRSLKKGDLVMCLDAVRDYDTEFPHEVIEVHETRIECKATAIRKSTVYVPSKGGGGAAGELCSRDTIMHYGFNNHNLLDFAAEQTKTA